MPHELQINVSLLKPPPGQYEFDSEIHALIADGDLTTLAGFLRKDRSSVSRTLSPDRPDCKSPFFHTLEYLWSFDAMGKGQTDEIQKIVNRHRSLWLPAPVVRSDRAKTSSRIGKELMELFEKELAGETDHVLLKEAIDVRDAVNEKIDEILSRLNTAESRKAVPAAAG